jgi:kumamolisin
VYILDQDLIRFGKFALAVVGTIITLVVTVGLLFFGVDSKQAVKEAREAVKEAQEAAKEAETSKVVVTQDRSESATLLNQMHAESDSLHKQVQAAQTNISDMTRNVEEAKNHVIEVQQQVEQSRLYVETLVTSISQDAKRMHSLVAQGSPSSGLPATGKSSAFSVPELAHLYNFPAELDGHDQRIGIIELGGGYQDSDLKTYFAQLKLPQPKVTWVSVDGAKNSPSNSDADTQVTLDIEIAGAVAPAAHIVLYFAPNTTQGFLNAIHTAVADQENRGSVLSISWGGPENTWTQAAMNQMNQALQAAAGQNITVIAAAGDNGVTDGAKDKQAHVDFPASSPWVLACGGTRIIVSEGAVVSEVVWNDGGAVATGGGVSSVFPLPNWQEGAPIRAHMDGHMGRGIPDVAANASPQSGYRLYIHGQISVLGGTAAAVPLWAGLIALINQGIGHQIGYINPVLYSKIGPAGILRSITEENNSTEFVKGCTAGPGWNLCTGWGSPDGKKLLQAFQSVQTRQN